MYGNEQKQAMGGIGVCANVRDKTALEVDRRMGEVEVQMNRLSNAVALAAKRSDELERRLQPILRPEPETSTGGGTPVQVLTDLASAIRAQAEGIESLVSRLAMMEERIEL